MELHKYSRRHSETVKIGETLIGGPHPIAVQSMTNTATADVEASVAQIERIATAGAPIVREIKRAVKIPVTVKIRAGFTNDNRNAPEMAKMLEDAGADLICIHGRTRQQYYQPYSDNGIIADVKRAVSVPVIGNGDLNCAEDVERMLMQTQCDGVMIARGALGNPWIFSEVIAALEGRPYTPPSAAKRLEAALAHAAALVERKGERIGLPEARKHLVWYCKGLRGAATARGELMQAQTLEGVRAVFDGLLAQNQ